MDLHRDIFSTMLNLISVQSDKLIY